MSDPPPILPLCSPCVALRRPMDAYLIPEVQSLVNYLSFLEKTVGPVIPCFSLSRFNTDAFVVLARVRQVSGEGGSSFFEGGQGGVHQRPSLLFLFLLQTRHQDHLVHLDSYEGKLYAGGCKTPSHLIFPFSDPGNFLASLYY